MNPQRLTEKAQEAIAAAQHESERRQHATLDVDHLLNALTTQAGGVVPRIFERLNVIPATVQAGIDGALERAARLQYSAQPTLSGHLRNALQRAEDEARGFNDDFISTEHLLLAALEAAPKSESVRVLVGLGLTRERIMLALTQIRGSQRVTD